MAKMDWNEAQLGDDTVDSAGMGLQWMVGTVVKPDQVKLEEKLQAVRQQFASRVEAAKPGEDWFAEVRRTASQKKAMNSVRILAPTGDLGYVPEEQLQAAIDAGAKVMTPDDMRQMRREIFMQHGIFRERAPAAGEAEAAVDRQVFEARDDESSLPRRIPLALQIEQPQSRRSRRRLTSFSMRETPERSSSTFTVRWEIAPLRYLARHAGVQAVSFLLAGLLIGVIAAGVIGFKFGFDRQREVYEQLIATLEDDREAARNEARVFRSLLISSDLKSEAEANLGDVGAARTAPLSGEGSSTLPHTSPKAASAPLLQGRTRTRPRSTSRRSCWFNQVTQGFEHPADQDRCAGRCHRARTSSAAKFTTGENTWPVKVGDVVLYRAFGRTVNAIIKAIRRGEVSHLGKNGEPLLTLSFIDPARQLAIAPGQKPSHATSRDADRHRLRRA